MAVKYQLWGGGNKQKTITPYRLYLSVIRRSSQIAMISPYKPSFLRELKQYPVSQGVPIKNSTLV
jgi:hypothetical protein